MEPNNTTKVDTKERVVFVCTDCNKTGFIEDFKDTPDGPECPECHSHNIIIQ